MRSPQRGQIFLLKGDSVGKKRPILVVSPTHLNGGIYLLGVPFYSQQVEKRRTHPTCVFFAAGEFGLDRDCVAKADEVHIFKISELHVSEGPVAEVDASRMELVSTALCYSLGIVPPK